MARLKEDKAARPVSITSTGIKGDRLLSSFVITFETGWRMWRNRYQRANWLLFVSQ
jgi:hypothetical protein